MMRTYVMMVNLDDSTLSWGFIPNTAWQSILRGWMRQRINGIGFKDIVTKEQLTRIIEFREWQPDAKFICNIEVKFQNKLVLQDTQKMAVFPYSDKMREIIEDVPFNDWRATDEDYPIDELYFFQDTRLIMSITPYESCIIFHVSDSERDELIKLDELIRKSLYLREDLKATVEILT